MLHQSPYFNLQISVPVSHADAVREALGKAGAGAQGNYEYCSGSMRQVGRFRPLPGAEPAIGEVGKFEEVEEELIHTICHKDILESVIEAVKQAHPYEEPMIDIVARFEVK